MNGAHNSTNRVFLCYATEDSARIDDLDAAAAPQPNPRDAWVDAVLAFTDIGDPQFRFAVLRRMGEQLGIGGPFPVAYHAMARDHAIEIVRTCWSFSDRRAALAAPAESLAYFRPRDQAAAKVKLLPDQGP